MSLEVRVARADGTWIHFADPPGQVWRCRKAPIEHSYTNTRVDGTSLGEGPSVVAWITDRTDYRS